MHIIIDGYNVMKSTRFSDDFQLRQLKNQREKFLSLLRDYRSNLPHDITVVFDGSKSTEFFIHKENYNGIKVVYSKSGQTADELIKSMVEDSNNSRNILVVTSDKGISSYIKAMGAFVSTAEEFYNKIKPKFKEISLSKGEYFERYVKGFKNDDNKRRF